MKGQTNQAFRAGRRGLFVGTLLPVLLVLSLTDVGSGQVLGQTGGPTVNAGIPSYTPLPDLTGNFVVTGSDTMQPLLLQMAAKFRLMYPKTKIAIQARGTEKGLAQFMSDQGNIQRGDALAGLSGQQVSGSVAIFASSRRLTTNEVEDFQSRNGYEPTEIPVAMGAVVIYVHKDNPVEGLSLDQLDAIFGRDRKRGYQEDISTWGQVIPQERLAQQPIHLYGRDTASATRTIMKNVALLDGEFKGTVQEQPGSASQILAIGRDPLGLGYVGLGFQTSAVRQVPLAEKAGMPFVYPTADSVTSGSYPMGRFLYLYAKKQSESDLKPVIREFLKFANSREGQQLVVRSGMFPLTSDQVAKNLQAVGDSLSAASLSITAGANHH